MPHFGIGTRFSVSVTEEEETLLYITQEYIPLYPAKQQPRDSPVHPRPRAAAYLLGVPVNSSLSDSTFERGIGC